jgi:branched-chain amino acid transport system permease protein
MKPETASSPLESPKINVSSLMVGLVIVALLAVFPFVVSNRFYLRLLNEMFIYGLLAMSLDVLLGFTGLLSFMHTSYLGIAAYSAGLFLKLGPQDSLWLAFLVGILATQAIAIPVGWVQVRTGGLPFALLTLAFGMMYFTVVWKWYGLTGGDDGLMGIPQPDLSVFGWVLGNSGNTVLTYLFTLFIVVICFLVTYRIIRSPFGAVLEAIRENEERAAFIGINVHRYKLLGWTLACLLASVAGVLFILYKGYIGPTTMDPFAGAAVLMMVLLGGMGSLWGAFIGAGLFIFMQDYLSTLTEHWEIFVGLIVVLLVIFLPRGFAGLVERLRTGGKA